MQNSNEVRHFVHVSFRLPLEVRESLAIEAARMGLNENAHVTKVLSKYVTFDRLVSHPGVVILDKRIFSRIIESVDLESLRLFGSEYGSRLVRQSFSFFGFATTLESLMRNYYAPMSRYSGWYEANLGGQSPVNLILEHDYGRKWSAFLSGFNSQVVKSILGLNPRVEVDDDSVSLHLDGLAPVPSL